MLQALFERSSGLVMGAVAHAAVVPYARERPGALVRVSASLVREHVSFWRIFYGVRFQHDVVAGLGDGIAAQSALYVQLFAALLAEIGRPDPELDVRQLFATLDGVLEHYVLDPENYPLDAMVEHIIHQFGGVPAAEPS